MDITSIIAFCIPLAIGMLIGSVLQRHKAAWQRRRIERRIRRARDYLAKHAPPPIPEPRVEPSVRIVPRTWGGISA